MRLFNLRIWLLGFVVFALAATGTAWGQAGTTAVSGEITDPQGAVISGATVTLTHPASGVSRTVTTDASGRYQFGGLRPGTYRIRVEAAGFRTAVQENIELLVDTPSRVPIALQVGTAAEVVEVVGVAPAVNTENAAVGNAITAAQVRNLPVEGGNVVHLLSLQPGALFLPESNQRGSVNENDPRSGSIAGARADQQNVTLDGVDVNDPVFGNAYTSVLRQTSDSVQEFKVSTTNYGSDQGRSSGGQVSLVTRSGTNELRGSAYWAHRNTIFSSNEYFNKLSQLETGAENERPVLRKHLYGAAVGGPVVRDRVFLFGNWQTLRQSQQRAVARAVPSATLRDGVLVYRCAVAAECPGGTVAGFTAQHTIPAGFLGMQPNDELALIDPLGIGASAAVSEYLRQYPMPNDPGADGISLMGFRFAGAEEAKLHTYIARADFKVDQAGNHSVFWRGSLQDDESLSAPQFPGQPPNTRDLDNSRGFALGYTSVLGPRVVNNLRYGFTRLGQATAGTRTGSFTSLRFLDFYPTSQASSNARVTATHNILNDVSVVRGNHTIQAGVNLRWTRVPRFSNAASWNTAVANGSWVSGVGRRFMPGGASCPEGNPGCALPAVHPDFQASYGDPFIIAMGIVSQANLNANYDQQGNLLAQGELVRRRYATNEYEWYLQDSWRLHPTFTVTAGLRWGYYSPPWETNGLEVAPDRNIGEWFAQRAAGMLAGIPANAHGLVSFDLSGPANNRPHLYERDFNNWAPRLGFAWSPSFQDGFLGAVSGQGRLVVRGGAAIFYDRIGQALVQRFDTGGAFGMGTSISSPFGLPYEEDATIRFQGPFVLPPHVPPAPAGGFPATPEPDSGTITHSLDASIRTPYSIAYNLMIGREMPWSSTLEVGYVGRGGRKLLVRRDAAMPLDLVDPASGMSYFQAAAVAIDAISGITGSAAANFANIPNIAYFENLWPTAGAAAGLGLTNTQTILRRMWIDEPDYITSLWLYDQICPTATRPCTKFGPFAFFDPQYDFLATSSSVANSQYHSMQVSWRKRPSQGLQFDVNYVFSKSMDHSSAVERNVSFGNTGTNWSSGGYTGFFLNPFEPRLHWAQSDFDVRHQINVNWIYGLPFGQGHALGGNANGVLNSIIGDWQLSGIWRQTSGFPMNIINCRLCWATNWNLQANAAFADPNRLPEMKRTHGAVAGRPSPFADPGIVPDMLRRIRPGEVGARNVLRGDGFFGIDVGIGKSWGMPYSESHRLNFRWDIFNVTNSARFDVAGATMTPDAANFGRYNQTLATCDRAAGRCMQFGFRYEF